MSFLDSVMMHQLPFCCVSRTFLRNLRQCLAFCAIFPNGYVLDREIINMWAAHGLLKPSPKKRVWYWWFLLPLQILILRYSKKRIWWYHWVQMPGLIYLTIQDSYHCVTEDADQLSVNSEDVRTLILSSTLYSGGSSCLDHSFLDFQELWSLDLSCSGIRNLPGT